MADLKQVLVVEDSSTQALKLCTLLEAEGFEAHHQSSGEKALDFLSKNRPDLILIDYHLPGMDGAELCRQLRMNMNTEGIPLLIMTGDKENELEREGLESGADDHIAKTMDSDAFMARIHALLRRPQTPFSDPDEGYYRKLHLLAVDDSPTFRVYLESLIAEEGYQTTSVGSGEEALEALAKKHFDCVLVDLLMPGMDGIQLCRKLDDYRKNSGQNLPIMMITNQDSRDDMMAALDAGADDFVSKSNDQSILKARIRSMLRRKIIMDEHERVSAKFHRQEIEILRERNMKEAAEFKASMAEKLQESNRQLSQKHKELKEMQAQLIQSAKIASLGELVAGIAHEINNPLAFVLSHLNMVRTKFDRLSPSLAAGLDEAENRDLAKIEQRLLDMEGGLQRVKDLILKLKNFSRIDEGEIKNCDIHENIEAVLFLLHHKTKDRIQIETDFGDRSQLSCQPGPLNQVLMNLISNAVDAIEDTGTIRIRTWCSERYYHISIADTGPGIPKKIRERIFEPFFTTKPVGEGTGLGLSISYKIIQAHNGQIQIEDNDGGGACFILDLPLEISGMACWPNASASSLKQ